MELFEALIVSLVTPAVLAAGTGAVQESHFCSFTRYFANNLGIKTFESESKYSGILERWGKNFQIFHCIEDVEGVIHAQPPISPHSPLVTLMMYNWHPGTGETRTPGQTSLRPPPVMTGNTVVRRDAGGDW